MFNFILSIELLFCEFINYLFIIFSTFVEPSVYVVFFNNKPLASAGTVMPVGVLYETDSTTLPLVLVWMPTALVISSMEVEGAGVVNEFSALGYIAGNVKYNSITGVCKRSIDGVFR